MTPSREPLVPSVFVNVAKPDNVDVGPVYLPFIRNDTHLGSQGVSGLAAPVIPTILNSCTSPGQCERLGLAYKVGNSSTA